MAQPGDLLLYRHDPSLVSTLIARLTGGPYSHVGVMVDASHSIEAHSEDGVQVRTPFLLGRDIDVVPVRVYGAREDDISAGLSFLHDQVGKGYSYADVFDNLPLLKRLGVSLAVKDRFDCSHLAADYIATLNCRLSVALRPFAATWNVVSPNDIARAAQQAQKDA